jgi:hypothetical protein
MLSLQVLAQTGFLEKHRSTGAIVLRVAMFGYVRTQVGACVEVYAYMHMHTGSRT